MKRISLEVPGTTYNYNGIQVCEAVYTLLRIESKLPEMKDHMGSTYGRADIGEDY